MASIALLVGGGVDGEESASRSMEPLGSSNVMLRRLGCQVRALEAGATPKRKQSQKMAEKSGRDLWKTAVGSGLAKWLARRSDNTKGGWAQTSPPLAFWSFPIAGVEPPT